MTDTDPMLSEEAVQKVLARALEIQSESPGALTVTQMREIALDMGIPVSAVDQALSEYRSADAAQLSSLPVAEAAPPDAPDPRRGFGRLVIVSLALVGAAVVLMVVISLIVRS